MQHLGRADPVEDVGAEPVAPPLADLLGERLSRGDADAQPVRSAGAPVARVREDGREQGRNAVEDRRPLLAQDAHHRIRGRAPFEQHHRRAHGERERHSVSQPVGEEELRGGEDDVVGAQLQHAFAVGLRRLHQILLQVHRAFGRPRRAAGVEPEGDVVGGGRRRLEPRRGGREQIVQLLALPLHDHVPQERLPFQDGGELLEQGIADDEGAGAAVAEHVIDVTATGEVADEDALTVADEFRGDVFVGFRVL